LFEEELDAVAAANVTKVGAIVMPRQSQAAAAQNRHNGLRALWAAAGEFLGFGARR